MSYFSAASECAILGELLRELCTIVCTLCLSCPLAPENQSLLWLYKRKYILLIFLYKISMLSYLIYMNDEQFLLQ